MTTAAASGERMVPAPVAAIRQQQQREWTTLIEEIALLRATDDTNALAMGDLFVETVKVAGGKQHLKLAAEQSGVEPIKAGQRYWVSDRIPPGHRLRSMMEESGLTFTHMRCLAGLDKDEDRITWARRSIAGNWTATRLREELALESAEQAKQGGVECCAEGCSNELSADDTIVTLRVDREKQVRACSHHCAIAFLQDDAKERDITLTGRCRPSEVLEIPRGRIIQPEENVVRIPEERLNREIRELTNAGVTISVNSTPTITATDTAEQDPDDPELQITPTEGAAVEDQEGDPPVEDTESEDPRPTRGPNLSAELDGLTDFADDPFAS